ncbi:MAG: phosphate signaling complex protein PhoU [Blastocatellia bacterium]
MSFFEDDLNLLRDRILLLGGAAEAAISRATRALIERDADLAESVIAEDDEIDSMENEIDQYCSDLLINNTSVDLDLRFVISVSRAAQIIERIADHAVNIAKHALVLIDQPQLKTHIELPQLASIAQDMLLSSLDALTRSDCQLAFDTIHKDDQADELFHTIYDHLVITMEQEPKTVRRAVELLFVIKHLERIADYATNISEMVIYLVEGRLIKHTPEAK